MSKGLILEKNLPHQDKAIDCTTRVFSGISVSGAREAEVNPVMNFEILNNKVIMDGHITRNVRDIQKENNIDNKNKNEFLIHLLVILLSINNKHFKLSILINDF